MDSKVSQRQKGDNKVNDLLTTSISSNIYFFKICITQPRRVAAVSLAKRVASELGGQLGHIMFT